MTEMSALNPVVCVTGIFRCEDSTVEKEGEVEIEVNAAVDAEVEAGCRRSGIRFSAGPTFARGCLAPNLTVCIIATIVEKQLPHLEPVQIKPVDPPHEPAVLIEELTP